MDNVRNDATKTRRRHRWSIFALVVMLGFGACGLTAWTAAHTWDTPWSSDPIAVWWTWAITFMVIWGLMVLVVATVFAIINAGSQIMKDTQGPGGYKQRNVAM